MHFLGAKKQYVKVDFVTCDDAVVAGVMLAAALGA